MAEEAAAQPEGAEKPETVETDARVPSWRLAEEANRRREAEQQLADMRAEMRQVQQTIANAQRAQQQPPQAQPQIDPFADPQGFAQSIQQSFDQRLQNIQLQNSLQFARFAHKETFDNAYQAFIDHAHKTRDAATYQRVMTSPDPGEALVQWHKEQQTLKELGGTDVNSWLEKKREEWLKDPAVQAKLIENFKASQTAAPSSNPVKLPPSLSRVTSATASHADSDASDSSMYSYATKG